MSIKRNADFPDLSRGLDRYEGLQRRSEQGRVDSVGRLLAGMDVVPLTDATGKKLDVIGRRSGSAELPGLSFAVIEAAKAKFVTVNPGVITGLNASYLTPLLAGLELYETPPPEIELKPSHWLFVRIEIIPQADGPEGLKYLSETTFTVKSVTVETARDTKAAQEAAVSESGEITNGIYLIPLAVRTAAGVISQTMYGPLSAKFCNGRLTITAPSVLQIVPII